MNSQLSMLDQAIAKYGGSDEAYKMKLKEHIRNGMGYSNWVSKRDSAMNAGLDLGNMKGNLTPEAVRSLVGGAIDKQQTEVGVYGGIADKFDSAAELIAAQQIADAKAAAGRASNKDGFDNGIAFQPQDMIDRKILGYMQNPKNPDGTIKSLQQFEAELNAEFGIAEGIDATQIKDRITQRMPADYIPNQDKYSMMAQGYSAKQAEELQGALNYNTMSEPEKIIFQNKNPLIAKELETGTLNKELLGDLSATTDMAGETVPKYSYDELKEKYPNVADTTLKALMTPKEKKSLQDDVTQWFTPKIKSAFKETMQGEPKDGGGYAGVMGGPTYKDLKAKLTLEYGSVFTSQEIDQYIYNTLMSLK